MSEQLHGLEAGVAGVAHDQMVVDEDAERLGGLRNCPRHLDIGARRRGVARGVVVDQAIVTAYLADITL
jgi:hypothetical protein